MNHSEANDSKFDYGTDERHFSKDDTVSVDLPFIYDEENKRKDSVFEKKLSNNDMNKSTRLPKQVSFTGDITEESGENPLKKLIKKASSKMSILRKAGQKDVVASPATESNVLDDILGGDENKKKYTNNDLLKVCKDGGAEELMNILMYGIDVNAKFEFDKTALHVVSQFGHIDLLELLVEKHINIRARDKFTKSPVHYACEFGHVEIVKFLQTLELELDEPDMYSKMPIHYACEHGHGDAVQYLLSQYVDFQKPDKARKTPLHYACEKGHLPIVIALIEFGADAHQHNTVTPLHCASKGGHFEIVKYLVEQVNVEVEAIDEKLRTALHLACRGGNIEIVRYLVNHGAKVHALTAEKKNAIHYACETDNLTVLKYLLFLKVNYEAKGGKAQITPLLLACKKSSLEIVRQLELKYANLLIEDVDEANALHYACEGGKFDTVKYLIEEKNFEVNCETKWGLIPIAFALRRNHFDIVNYLIARGSRLEDINENMYGVVNLLAPELSKQDEHTARRYDLLTRCLKEGAIGREDKYDETLKCIMQTKDLSIIAYALIKYLHALGSPITFLNAEFAGNDSGDDSNMMVIFRNHLQTQDPMVLYYLINCVRALDKAADCHYTEMPDIIDVRKKFEVMINEVFSCNSFDEHENVLQILHPLRMLEGEKVTDLSSFEEESVVTYCLEREIPIIFDKPQVNNLIERVFYSVFKTRTNMKINPKQYHGFSFYTLSFYFYYDEAASERQKLILQTTDNGFVVQQRKYLQSIRYTHALRSNPGVIMFGEFLSKSVLLWLLAMVAIMDYGMTFQTDFSRFYDDDSLNNAARSYTPYETWLLIFAVMDMTFEVGQGIEDGGEISLASFVEDEWNFLDRLTSTFLIVWIVLRFIFVSQLPAARIVLSVAAIPMSFGLLRYLSIYEPLGELVILIKAMCKEIFNVIIVYFVCILGFGITFYSLFYEIDPLYSSPGFMLLTLLRNTLVDFNFDIFITNNDGVNVLGIVLLVIFLVFTAIVLMNLLIAQMSSSYEEMKEKSAQQWSFMYAKLVAEYMLLVERHVFCLLPPPCNALTICLWPFHFFAFRYFNLSIGGTFANFLYSQIYGTFFRLHDHILHIQGVFIKDLPEFMERRHFHPVKRFFYTLAYIATISVLLLLDSIFLPTLIFLYELCTPSLRERTEGKSSQHVYLIFEYVNDEWEIFYPDIVHVETHDHHISQHGDSLHDDDNDDDMPLSFVDTISGKHDKTKRSPKVNASPRTPSPKGFATHASFMLRKMSSTHSENEADETNEDGEMNVSMMTVTSMVYFKENDIPRILRPLKSYIKSLNTNELQRLESNVSQETLRLRNDIGSIIDKEMARVRKQTQEGQDALKHDLLLAQNKFTLSINGHIQTTQTQLIDKFTHATNDLQKKMLDLDDKMKLSLIKDVAQPQTARQDTLEKNVAGFVNQSTDIIAKDIQAMHIHVNSVYEELEHRMNANDASIQNTFSNQLQEVQDGMKNESLRLHSKVVEIDEKVSMLESRMMNMENSLGEILRLVKVVATKTTLKAFLPTPSAPTPTTPAPQVLCFDAQTQTNSDAKRLIDQQSQTSKVEMKNITVQTKAEPTPSPPPPPVVVPTHTVSIQTSQVQTRSRDVQTMDLPSMISSSVASSYDDGGDSESMNSDTPSQSMLAHPGSSDHHNSSSKQTIPHHLQFKRPELPQVGAKKPAPRGPLWR